MRPTRSTVPVAVVAVIVALQAFQGPWWARAAPMPLAQATGQTPTQATPTQATPTQATPPAEPPKADAAPAAPPPAAAAPSLAPAPPAAPAPAPAPPKVPADSIGPLAGANVTVYLRADAVGSVATGASPGVELRNLVMRRGAFVRSDADWFVLKNESQEVWVPRTSIALVEMR